MASRPRDTKVIEVNFSFLLAALASLSLPTGLSPDDAVTLDEGVRFYGVEAPEQVTIGEPLALTFHFGARDALDPHDSVFVHLEGRDDDGAAQKRCRIVRDVPLTRSPDDGAVTVELEVPIPQSCEPGSLEIYAGMWNRKSHERRRITSRSTLDDRIHAGYAELVDGEAAGERRAIAPSQMRWREIGQRFEPWWGWITGVLVMCGLVLVARRFGPRLGADAIVDPERSPDDLDADARGTDEAAAASAKAAQPGPLLGWLMRRPPRWLLWSSFAVLLVPLGASLLAALDFIKDDAYISFRYAHNLARGEGLVFNPGEHLEGFTNFLWTLLMVPFEALGLDLFQVSEILGTALSIGLLVTMMLLAVHFHGGRRHLGQLWGGLWLATSSSMALWATSGMEQPLAMLLPFASVYFLWEGRERQRTSWTALGGALMGLGCMTRPEIHAMAMVVGAALLFDAVRTRTLPATTRTWLIAILAVTVPFHLFRIVYFGEWLPNTYYVKTGESSLVWLSGLEKLHEMFDFNHLGFLVVLAPAAFIDRRRTLEKLVLLAIAVGFMVYIVKVGVDEMRWHRLYLPALPFLVLLAALGLRNLVAWASGALRRYQAVPVALFALAWVAVVWASWDNFKFTYKEMHGFNGRGDLAGTYHPDIGKFITRHDRPGALAAFQDMGSTPYYAPDIDFLDFIGLVDGTVARARHAHGLHPFVATENYRNQKVYDAQMRDYFKQRAPEWTILTSYVHQSIGPRIAADFERDPRTDHLANRRSNSYQFDIESDPWFAENYVHVRTWPRSATYYLSLYRRRDLWEKTPGEVVLDAVPEGLEGPTARFSGGLELLGVEVERIALERGEFFVTTWWRAPGPMDRDLFIFLHLNREGYQAPYDHVPGDWMYPAERWRQGDVIEDRVLVQIPVNAEPGQYELNLGLWNRRTGERLAIEQGPGDGQNRIPLGSVEITPMRLFLDHLIPPTRIEEQRKYPERIIEHGRR